MKNIAIVGTQGVPAHYGGFETLVENLLGENCPEDIKYTVFCSSVDKDSRLKEYKGARLKYIPLKANGIQSTLYDIWSLSKCLRGYDVILVLGVSGCVCMPVLKLICKKKVVVNVDGMEWKRSKWKWYAKWFLRLSERMAVKYADLVIADNQGIVDYIEKEYHKFPVMIAYGSDQVEREVPTDRQMEILNSYGIKKKEYAISVCRIEPENNCDMILDAFAHTDMKIIFIGNWEHSEYGMNLKKKYEGYKNIRIVNATYDLDVLYALRHNSRMYIHGHSAGGTNPSLVEAMFCGCNIFAYDVEYNRETTSGKAYYFKDAVDLAIYIWDKDKYNCEDDMYRIAKERYTWKKIAGEYIKTY